LNYKRHYDLLILKSQNRKIADVIEKHHILPKSLGGSDTKENIAYLTPKEHYVAHHLLWKIHRNREMHFAFWLLATKCSNRKEKGSYNVNSRTYQLLREQHSKEVSKIHTGKVRSDETKNKKSESAKKRPMPTNIHSDEAKEKRKLSNEQWRQNNQLMCPHCNKIGVSFNMKRYHVDNCKYKEG